MCLFRLHLAHENLKLKPQQWIMAKTSMLNLGRAYIRTRATSTIVFEDLFLSTVNLNLGCFCVFTVIRARLVGVQEVEVGNNIYGSPITRIQYDVKQVKVSKLKLLSNLTLANTVDLNPFYFCLFQQMFKGPEQNIDAIYTAPFSSLCGVTLETNNKEYLITGRISNTNHAV